MTGRGSAYTVAIVHLSLSLSHDSMTAIPQLMPIVCLVSAVFFMNSWRSTAEGAGWHSKAAHSAKIPTHSTGHNTDGHKNADPKEEKTQAAHGTSLSPKVAEFQHLTTHGADMACRACRASQPYLQYFAILDALRRMKEANWTNQINWTCWPTLVGQLLALPTPPGIPWKRPWMASAQWNGWASTPLLAPVSRMHFQEHT